jgi:hypothetical protein
MEKEKDVSEKFIVLTDLQRTDEEQLTTVTVEPEPPDYQSVVQTVEGQTADGNVHHMNQDQHIIVEQPRTTSAVRS